MSKQIFKPKGSKFNFFSKLKFNKIFIGLFIAFATLAIVAGIGFLVQNNSGKTAFAATCTWSGDNSGDFSDSGNWSACPTGSGVPEDYDEMYFPSSANNYYLNNDLNLSYYGAFVVAPLTNQSYVLSGNDINNWQSLDIQAGGGGSFTFRVNALFCGINGGGRVEVDSGYTLTSGCGNNATYNFSGIMSGSGTFSKEGGGTQILENATFGSYITTDINGYFVQPQGNTQIYGPVYSTGGVLFQPNTITVNNFTQNGGGINLYPGNVTNFNSYNLNSGNFASDSFSGTYGRAFVSNNMYVGNGTLSMRFFGSYNVGEAYTIIGTTGGATLSGEFTNAPEDSIIIAEGWGPSSIINDVGIKINYTSNSVVATIVSVTSKACTGNKTYTQSTGTVTSGTIDYLANSNCKFIIAPSNADSVTLDFTNFNTYNANDVVNVYDGITTSSPLLGTFSGNNVIPSLTADSGVMLITFTSDATDQTSGFSANWSTVEIPGPTISNVNVGSGSTAGGTNITANGVNFVSGQYQNINTIGGSGLDGVRGMVMDTNGNQYITGGFTGTLTLGATTLTSSGSEDVYVAKINPDGTYGWAVSAGGSGIDGFDRRQSLKLDTIDDTLIISGYFGGSATFGSTNLNGFGSNGSNIFVSKLNKSNGSFVWAKQAGASTADVYDGSIFPTQFGGSIDVDNSGNIYISGRIWGTAGSTATFGSISKTILNGQDPYIAKMDSDGNFQWVKNYADTDSSGLSHGLKVNSNGDVYAMISFQNTLDIGGTTVTSYCPTGCQNAALIKLANDGSTIWVVPLGSTSIANNVANGNDLPYDVGLDSNENVYITGYFVASVGTFGSFTLYGTGTGSSVYTAKVNPSGTFMWAKALPNPGFATSRTMFIDSNDKIWIAGGYDNILTDGVKSITGNSTNAFFAQYDTSGNLVDLKGISGTGGQLAVTGVGGNQVRALSVYNGKLYIAGEYFDTIGIGGKTITSAGNQDGFYTNYSPNDVSIKVGGVEVIASYISDTELRFTAPPNTTGFKDVIVTNSNGQSSTLTNGFEYIGVPITNTNISAMTCSPTTTNTNTTVNCVITTNIDINTLGGSVNVRIGSSGAITNCPISGAGNTITCNNVAVGNAAGTSTSQYNASGSGSTYVNGNNIIITQGPIVTINPVIGPTTGGTLTTATIAYATFAERADVVQISAGNYHTCALLSNGKVRCWGGNYSGELGYGNKINIGDNEPAYSGGDVNVGGTVTQISTGDGFTCALLTTGNVRCWGENYNGALGYGNTIDIGDNELPYTAGDVNVGGTVTQISSGEDHTCALLTTGNVRCWGSGDYGQLGYGNTTRIGDNELPYTAGDVNVGGTVTQISTGDYYTCALLSTGNVRCWGNATTGELGYGNIDRIGDNELPNTAGDVNVGGTVTQISTGDYHTCALLTTGNVRCWGYNNQGELGYGNTTQIGDNELPYTAGDVNVGGTVTQLSVGAYHTCVLLSTNNIRCWGANWDGMLGYGNNNYIGDDELPYTAGDVNVGGTVTSISSAAGDHTCVILSTKNVRCWGANYSGELGYGNTNNIGDNETPASAGDVLVINPSGPSSLSMTFDGIQANSVTFVNSTTITAITPAHAVGAVDVIITDGGDNPYTLTNGFTYQSNGTSSILNSNISSLTCSPTTTNINTTVNCTITTNVNLNTLGGSVNVRIGTGGSVVNCPVIGSGTTLNCNNVPVGSTQGTFRSQYNASGSGSTYLDGNDIVVTTNSGNGGTCSGSGAGSGTPGQTVVDLCVDGGALTLYAGDSVKDNDICSTADIIAGNIIDTTISGQSVASVTCNTTENSIALSPVTVDTKRQFTTAIIDDIIFEDLRGLATSNYTVTATVSNFADPQDANKRIDLGSNPDTESNEIDQDKPSQTDDRNKIFGVLDPSIATITPLRSAATIAFGTDNYIKGSRTTLIDNVTQVTLLSTSSPTKSGRIALDNVLFKLRIPSLVSAGNFQGTIVQTVI